MGIHQVLAGARAGDAITSMALNIQAELLKYGKSNIFAVFPDDSVAGEVLPVQALDQARSKDLLIYHASYGIPDLTKRLTTWPGEIVLCWHNVTPPKFFHELDPQFADGLSWATSELEILRSKIIKSFADSSFNAQDLHDLGYSNVHVLPVGVDSQRLAKLPPDIRIANYYNHMFPQGYAIAISQLLPHKRVELAVAATHQARELLGLELGLVVVGSEQSGPYSTAVRNFGVRLLGKSFMMTGRLNDRQLSTLLGQSLLYVGMSEHEGLSIPLIEAMALGVPALVRDFGAIAETAADGARVLPPTFGPIRISEEIELLTSDQPVRRRLIGRGFRRSSEFEKEKVMARFIELMDDLLE